MTKELSELNLPIVNVPMMAPASPAEQDKSCSKEQDSANYYDVTQDIQLPPEVDPNACSHIAVSMESMEPCTYDANDPAAMFNVVLRVTCTNPETQTCTSWKLVKRLAFDKCKLAVEAESTTPVSVVEEKDRVAQEKIKHMVSRFKAMAGLE